MTDEEVRTLALSAPEAGEGEHGGLPTFTVRGRRFVTLGWPGPRQAALALSPDEADLLLGAGVAGVARAAGAWGRRGHVHLDLAAADDATVRSVLAMAWRRAAPAALAKACLDPFR